MESYIGVGSYIGDIKDFIEFLNNKGVEFNGYVLFEGINNLTNKLVLFKTHEQNDCYMKMIVV